MDRDKKDRTYIAIDLKSFFASVECVERGLDPLTTNLVVADASRTEKTICLAVSPSLKSYGIPGRARLFEVVQRLKEVNASRRTFSPGGNFSGESCDSNELAEHNEFAVSYIAAPPRMAYYMKYSTDIYNIYLKYVAPEDMHVYSIDEVFMDVTDYLSMHGLSPHGLAKKIMQEVLETTGITATAGIGTNLYLAKIAMDIMAKHIPADENGVRIASLDEMSYRRELWTHRPLTDFWRAGQVLQCAYEADKARLVMREMTDTLVLDLVEKHLVTDQIVITVGYDVENLTDPARRKRYRGKIVTDHYGRQIPQHAHGTANLDGYTSSTRKIMAAVMELYDRIVDKDLLVRRMNISANRVIGESDAPEKNDGCEQLDFFTDYDARQEAQREESEQLARERKLQEAEISIKKKFGKNAVLKGMNLEEGATAKNRNRQIGGHKA